MNPGTRIGQYRILRRLGAGGMGAVYLAEHTLIGRRAAIKALLPSLSVQRDIVDRFFNEARATSSIADPGIVQVFDFGFHVDGTAYIVMELLEGEPLDARIVRLGRIRPGDALRIIRQAAGSLASAHSRGIVHRDLKPENIFMVPDPEAQGGERPKILDFGIAKLGTEVDGWLTQTGAMLGTPIYMSPEQSRGAGRVDARSDVYALGCVLFHMLTGRPPFEGEGVGDIIAAHLREPPPRPSSLVPTLPPPVDELVLRCLEKDPEARYRSMFQLQNACGAVLARISDHGTSVDAPEAELLLSAGFRSVYDGRGAVALRHVFDGTTLGELEGHEDEEDVPRPRGVNPIRAAAAILLVGGAIAVAAAMQLARMDGHPAEPAPAAVYASTAAVAPPPTPPPPVEVDAAVAPAAPAPAAADPAPPPAVPLALPEEPAAAKRPAKAKVAAKKAKRPPSKAKKRPTVKAKAVKKATVQRRSRPAAPPTEPVSRPSQLDEGLYERR